MPIDQLNSDIGGLLKVISFLIIRLQDLERWVEYTEPKQEWRPDPKDTSGDTVIQTAMEKHYIERAKVREGIRNLSHDPGYMPALMSRVILGEEWEE